MGTTKIRVIRAVIFDFDGTLTKPGVLDFAKIKEDIDCPPDRSVLEFISEQEEVERNHSLELLDRFEYRAAELSKPNSGSEGLLSFLNSHNLPYCIVSRNSRRSVLRALENFSSVSADDFKVIISRDDHLAPKPAPEAIFAAAKELDVPVDQILSVGDFIYDVQAGRRSGVLTVYLSNGLASPSFAESPDYIVDSLLELEELLDHLRPLPAGKLPNRFLEESLKKITLSDPQLLVGPGVGEDVAAVELSSCDEVLVLKSDPITFPTSKLGYYAVVINANDLATTGARPRWLLTTLLLPTTTNAAMAQRTIAEIEEFCRQYRVQLCGGHTEITGAVTQPVVVAQLTGTVARKRLLEKGNISTGDQILMTQGVAIEGTATLATEFPAELKQLGLSDEELSSAQNLLYNPGISILKEAQSICMLEGVTAMHDVTEGGIATALEELSSAGNKKIRIERNAIPVLPETARVCHLLGLDPLGLLGSGSLLITCSATACPSVLAKLRTDGIPAVILGEVLAEGRGVEETEGHLTWPKFDIDEISRAFDALKG